MPKPVYLIQGDPLFRAQKIAALTESLAKNSGPLETASFRLADSAFEDIFLKLRNKPFFAQTQIFIIPDASALENKDLEHLKSYLAKPSEFSVLVFEWEDEEEKYRGARVPAELQQLGELVKNAGGVIEKAAAGSKAGVGLFLREKLRAAGKTASPEAFEKMESAWQDFPALLDSAVNNIILAAGAHNEITAEMVDSFDDQLSKGDRFKFLEALLARNPRESLNAFARLLDAGDDDPMGLISFLHSQFRLYWQAQRLLQRGAGEAEVFRKLGISQGRSFFFKKQMRVFSLKQLEAALEQLFELDLAVKTGEGEAGSGLERWVVQTAGAGKIAS